MIKFKISIFLSLDEANKQLGIQSEERTNNHEKLLHDIQTLQHQASTIFKQIG